MSAIFPQISYSHQEGKQEESEATQAMEDLFDRVSNVLDTSDAAISDEMLSLEPTPIANEGVLYVDTVPLPTATWNSNQMFFHSLGQLLNENKFDPRSNFQFEVVSPNQTHQLGAMATCQMKQAPTLNQAATEEGEEANLSTNHMEQWKQRFEELVVFEKEHNHCLVPLNWPSNPSLAHWVKRQRYQYRIKMQGKHSTLTDERQNVLEALGFVWDSHALGWEERLNELRGFKDFYGHCNVPKKYSENPQLATWVKCQRRQFKLYSQGKNSNMTAERVQKLLCLGFVFDPRSARRAAKQIC